MHTAFCDLKSPANFGPWFRKIQNQYKDMTEETAKQAAKDILKRLKPVLGNQYSIIGTKNAWILKPGGQSRGRGITIHSKFGDLVQTIESSQQESTVWVVQKYIENPMIILGKKFDIRQWVVVTSWNPLRIFYFHECYLRFTSDNYDPSRLHNKFMHLTNNCIASQSKNFDNSSIEGNMWNHVQFASYLDEEYKQANVYSQKIVPQIKQGIIGSILAAREMVVHRENTHEMFGYDFMVDTNLKVWLIEVNSSPSMEHSTVSPFYFNRNLACY